MDKGVKILISLIIIFFIVITLSVFALSEAQNNPGINLKKIGEIMPKSGSNTPSGSGGNGGGGGSSVTNIYNIYNVTNVIKENEGSRKEEKAKPEEASGGSKITGAIIGTGKQLLSGWKLIATISIIAGVFVVIMIRKTIIRIKKK